MDVDSLPLFAALKKRMKWLNTNQSVLSENIANADTPNYAAKQLKKQDFSRLVDGIATGTPVGARATRVPSVHGATGASAASYKAASAEKIRDTEVSLSGNSVVLEEEMLKLANNQMEYSMVVKLYRKNMGLLKIALGRGAGR